MTNKSYNLAIILLLSTTLDLCYGHGYMSSPRSRQLVAFEDGSWAGGDNLPEKENCPSCANIKNADGFCGKVQTRDYDFPKDGNGNPYGPVPQAIWTEGQYVEMEFVYTANHQGHHVTYGCPDFDNPTKECFEQYPLEFVEDLTVQTYGTTYNAPKDELHPERAYVDPAAPVTRMRFKLPEGLYGDPNNDNLVLLQWHWLTGNSCLHADYDQYPFPPGWSPDNMGQCPLPYSDTGIEVPPEQFWNCAEVQIIKAGPTTPAPTKSPSSTEPPTIETDAPTKSPVDPANGCCSQNYQSCDATWCGDNESACLSCGSAGDKTWLYNGGVGAGTCIARYGDCTNDVNGCCDIGTGPGTLECIGNEYYRQCMVSLNPAPTTSPPTPSPSSSPVDAPTAPSPQTSSPTKSPSGSSNPALFSTGNTRSSYEAILELDYITNVVETSPPVWALVASGGAAGAGNDVVSEGQGYALMVTGITLAAMDVSDPNRQDTMNRFYAFFGGWKRMCENSTPVAYCQSNKLCADGTVACLPGWKHNKFFTEVTGTGSAPDGDEDAIVGMIMAIKAVENDAQKPSWYDEVRDWADRSSTSFLLHNTKLSNSGQNRILKLGSCWGGWEQDGNNPSYHSQGSFRFMRDFQDTMTDERTYSLPSVGGSNNYHEEWSKLIDTSYKFVEATQCDDIGIVPNWALATELADGSITGYPGSFSGSGTPQYEFGAEASRTLWRILFDAALYPEEAFEDAENILHPVHGRLAQYYSNSNWPDNTLVPCDGVTTVFGGWRYNAFMYAPVYSTLVLEAGGVSTETQQEMIDAAGSIVNAISSDASYYSRCWSIIGIITLNGDVAKAGENIFGESTDSPTISPTPSFDCLSLSDKATCNGSEGCSWRRRKEECNDALSTDECSEFTKRAKCKNKGCIWKRSNKTCKGRWN